MGSVMRPRSPLWWRCLFTTVSLPNICCMVWVIQHPGGAQRNTEDDSLGSVILLHTDRMRVILVFRRPRLQTLQRCKGSLGNEAGETGRAAHPKQRSRLTHTHIGFSVGQNEQGFLVHKRFPRAWHPCLPHINAYKYL